MERHLDQALEDIRQQLLRMGAMVEEMVAGSVQALVERDTERSESIIEQDNEVDQRQIGIV